MRALASRELTVAARTAALPLAALAILAASTAFVLTWAALVRIGPARAIAGKIAGSLLVQGVVILTGLPALVLAQQAGAVPMAGVAADLLPLFGLALLIAAASTAAILLAADEVRAWIWSSLLVFTVLLSAAAVAPDLARLGAVCALAGCGGTAFLCVVVGRRVGSPVKADGH
jgi:hypothetical protein